MNVERSQNDGGLRTRTLSSGADFAALWGPIQQLRGQLGAEHDVTLDPLHFLAYTDETRRSCAVACFRGEALAGVMYATQHYSKGWATGLVVGGDFAGRGLLLCAPEDESNVLGAGVERLLASGIHSMHLRMLPQDGSESMGLALSGCKIASYDKRIAGDRMELGSSFAELVSGFGRRTRKNITQHRRMLLEGGYRFVPEVSQERYAEALRWLNGKADFNAAGLRLVRDERLLRLHQGMRLGIESSEGVLVSALCGFVRRGRFHLLTQLNDSSLSRLSLSTVLRTYLMEHLIGMGVGDLQVMGGSSLALGRYFAPLQYRSIYIDKDHGMLSVAKRGCSAATRLLRKRGKPIPSALAIACGAFLRQFPEERELHSPPAAAADSEDSAAS